MNKWIIIVLFTLGVLGTVRAQSVQQLIDQVEQANLQQMVAELSGEQATTVNSNEVTITTRVHNNNDLAAAYLEERLALLPNLDVSVENFNTTGKNVIATQWGTTNPNDIYMICAHYDSVTTFCADDNTTGVSAVLEIARLLSKQCTANTIIYALWDEEEIGLLGSGVYANQAAANGANIMAVVNMDMIGYDGDAPGTPGDNDFDIDVRDIANSLAIKDDLLALFNTYAFNLNPIVVDPGTTLSDHSRFWNQNYSALLVGESWSTNDQNPFYHTPNDRISEIDFEYMTEITKLVLAYTATKSQLLDLDNTVSVSNNQLTATEANATYQWINCDTSLPIVGETNQTFAPNENGNYAVEITSGACTELSDCIAINSLSSSPFEADEIRIYPNPVTTELTIENPLGYLLNIQIKDGLGQIISTTSKQDFEILLDISKLASGIYFISISNAKKQSRVKIIKS